ncbi:hypothetical protein CDD81_632 [Ophiocordyceps australis]|uniref:DNA endonuclease activator Ctp1 C-terminal domain-containing protein n=1 Tax=Ophiocordyceps australis TaxID=1399860 RepID=A0A2C5Y2Q5_9HYPO|nr:hypothetical protein CDD81_632 [Ophiocordyceps australis]
MSLQHLLSQGRQTVLEALDQALMIIEQGAATDQYNINDRRIPSISHHVLENASATRQPEPDSSKKILPSPASWQAPSAKQQPRSSDSDAKNAYNPSEDLNLLKADYSLLQRKFDALLSNFKLAKDALQKRKDERDGWVQHANRLEDLIRAAEKKYHIRILGGNAKTAEAQINNVVDAEPVTLAITEVKSEPQLPPLPRHGSPTSENREILISLDALDSTQSDSNDGTGHQTPQIPARDLSANPTADSQPSSSIPVIVSERIVKKRRCEEQTTIKKEISNSSSPVLSNFKFKPNTQGSLDLGEIGQKIVTPRRRRQTASPAPATDNSASELVSPDTTPIATLAKGAKRPQPATILGQSTVLTPISVNVHQIKSSLNTRSNQRHVKPGLEYAIGALAEDGNSYNKLAPTSRGRYKDKSARPESRLDILLNSPLSVTDENNERSHLYSRTSTTNNALIPNRRSLPFATDVGATNSFEQNVTPSRLGMTRPKPAISHERLEWSRGNSGTTCLRNKPLSELQLDDFKVNSSINDGHAFAFTEIVRDKNERACLPGCTELSCCGKQFRALAMSQRPDPPLTTAQRMEEQKLLEEYLGDEAFRLASMTSEERLEVWVEAKAQELANKFGKHRHRFSRMQSPPGFWNPDFPTTQELEEEHAEAFKRQRQAVETRYREAMRTDGKWIFRDE